MRSFLLGGLVVLLFGAPLPLHAQGTLSALDTDVKELARAARASVVTVLAQRTGKVRAARGKDERRILTRVGSGVAVGVSEILTTASVVADAERIMILTDNGLQVDAQVAGVDSVFNIALLRVPDLRLPTLPFSTQRVAREGDWVMALGTSYRAQPTMSLGNVAYRHREPRFALLQLSNNVYPGNSGGAALNARGELIGLIQGELASDPTLSGERRPWGVSFALAVESVRPAYESLRRIGRVPHGYLGISTRAASVESETERGARIPIGALVERVAPEGPARLAGIRRGDLIVGFDRERVEDSNQLARWVAAARPGTPVEIVWVRDEIRHAARVELGEAAVGPQLISGAAPSLDDRAGEVRITDLERQIRKLNGELRVLKRAQTDTAP